MHTFLRNSDRLLKCVTPVCQRNSPDSRKALHIDPKNLFVAKCILANMMNFRRSLTTSQSCTANCPACQAPHLGKMISAVETRKPVRFVLPAFPAKSPNPNKVLGPGPDLGEHLALAFLQRLCTDIRSIYPVGAKIILCSDGRVFSDVVGMKEEEVTFYQNELSRLIERIGADDLELFNLDKLWPRSNFSFMRRKLMDEYGVSLEELKQRIRGGPAEHDSGDDSQLKNMHLGITRFLVEDAQFPGQKKSRTAIQKESKEKSFEVIRRSNAWSRLIEDYFPDAVRLSIHPQLCGSKKIGIQLIGKESWMTPWHGVVVQNGNSVTLMKRQQAEASGGRLTYSPDGRPSHYVIDPGCESQTVNQNLGTSNEL